MAGAASNMCNLLQQAPQGGFGKAYKHLLWAHSLFGEKQALRNFLTQANFAGHREEIKKINRDKAQLSDRLKEAEGAQLRLDGEVHSLKAAAAVSSERNDASVAQLEKRLQRTQEAVQAKQDEVRTPAPPPNTAPLICLYTIAEYKYAICVPLNQPSMFKVCLHMCSL